MAVLNTDLGETVDSSTADTGTLTPGTGKGLRQGVRGLQQRKFRIGVKKMSVAKMKRSSPFKSPAVKFGSKSNAKAL